MIPKISKVFDSSDPSVDFTVPNGILTMEMTENA
jgi:hypothetical protein